MSDAGLRYVFEWNRRRVPDPKGLARRFRRGFSSSAGGGGMRLIANVKPALLTSHPLSAAMG